MLANPMKGEAQFGEHRLIANFNRMCALEEAAGLKFFQLLAEMEIGLGLADLRLWIRTLLDKSMTLDEVGEIIGTVGPEDAIKALSDALEAFFAPMAKEKKVRPREAA